MHLIRILFFIAASVALSACSTKDYYVLMQEQQKETCRKLVNIDDRANCLKRLDTPYETYKAEQEAAKNGRK